jgi:hypothetical protein
MAHLRSQTFDAYTSRLSAIPMFSAAGKVKWGRAASIPQELLPALTLTWAEASEVATIRPSAGPNGEDGYDRALPLSIIVHLRDNQPEREFDDICTLVEGVMGANIVLAGMTIEALLQSTRFFVDPKTGLALCVGSLTYGVSYKTLAADPTIPAI